MSSKISKGSGGKSTSTVNSQRRQRSRANQTNKKQLQIMVEWMERHQPLAKNSLQTTINGKKKKSELWGQLSDILNSNGPPIRNSNGWQKVWRDFKYNTKRKLEANKKSIAKTSGGLNETIHLTPLEKTVISVAGLEASVSGLQHAKNYGPGSNNAERRPASAPAPCVDDIEANLISLLEDSTSDFEAENVPPRPTEEINNTRTNNCSMRQRSGQNLSPEAYSLFKEELQERKEFHTKLLAVLQERNSIERDKLLLEKE